MKTTLKKIGIKVLTVLLAFGTAFFIGYAAVIGSPWLSIITLGAIGMFLVFADTTQKQIRQ